MRDLQESPLTFPHQSTKNKLKQLAQRQGYFTFFITFICLLIYLLERLGLQQDIEEWLHYPAYFTPDWQFWRYFSHSLVHLSEAHILFNLLWWWTLGAMIERQLGALKFILFYFAAAIFSGVVQNWVSGFAFFGLSGVVYALLGYVIARHYFVKSQEFKLPEGFFTMTILSLVLGFAAPLININLGNSAHLSGLLLGLFLGRLKVRGNF